MNGVKIGVITNIVLLQRANDRALAGVVRGGGRPHGPFRPGGHSGSTHLAAAPASPGAHMSTGSGVRFPPRHPNDERGSHKN